MNSLKALKVFIASPGDLEKEREIVFEVCESINNDPLVKKKAVVLEPVGWEAAVPAAGRPQEMINALQQGCDIFICMLHKRYGTPTGTHDSGTEEEFLNAYDSWRKLLKPNILFYFKNVTISSIEDMENEQLKKVLQLKQKIEKNELLLFGTFDRPETFRAKVTEHLKKIIGDMEPTSPGYPKAPPLKENLNLAQEIRNYCEKADSIHATLPMAGFKTKLRVPIQLEDIYVPLRAMINLKGTGHTRSGNSESAEKELSGCGQGKEISLLDAFREIANTNWKGIVLLGDPGSGKTTHLKRLLLWCLRGGLAKLGLPSDMIPVFLRLRELKVADLSSGVDDFIQAQLNQVHLKTPEGFGAGLLKRGNLLFLFDGLDEVADPKQRAKVSRWIEKAVGIHNTCRFVVTCRFAGYTDKAQLNAHFLEMHIRPLDEGEASRFIHQWYRLVETGLPADRDQAEIIAAQEAEKLIARLKQPEFRSRRVFELTRNPLLLTNLCLVNRDRGGNLPKERAKLYEECTDVLLELWRDAISFPCRVTAQTGRRVLQPAALWMHQEEGRTRATARELAPVIEPALKSVRWDDGDAKTFLETVQNESGLLTGWGAETFGFMHLGFQEYLAAREIRILAYKDPEILRNLAAHFGESWWQEVILILLALEEPSHFEAFMTEVVKLQAFAENVNIVDMCLDDAAEISLKPFIDLIKQPPGKDPDLHKRQFEALKLVERQDPESVFALSKELKNHPYDPIRNRFLHRADQALQDIIINPKDGYELVKIPSGSFQMGSNEVDNEKLVHKVQLSGFYMGRYPVTNEAYEQFLKANPGVSEPKYWGDRKFNQPKQPVVGVSWEEATKYAAWAGLALPTEAQWEYACRAGTTTRYYTGDSEEDLARSGWYDGNSEGSLHPVGEKEPNGWGVYDMHGNVWEWCQDWYDRNYYAESPSVDPTGPKKGTFRLIRGGSWGSPDEGCRASYRINWLPENRRDDLGFRLVLLLGQHQAGR